jgi:transmembrane sensor
MTTKLSPQEIDRQAALWAARRENLSPEEQGMFDAWLKADVRHLGAYAKAEAVLAHLQSASGAGEAFHEAAAPVTRRRAMLAGSMAATVAVLGASGFVAWRFLGQQTYATRLGETQVIPLADGSVITLNTASEVQVHYTKDRRDIALVHGEALFDVAKDKARPFIVTAADTQVRAVGTSFNVKALPDQPVQVLVQEGIVEVKRPDVAVAAPVRVAANTKAIAPAGAPIATQAVTHTQVTRDLAWRVGRIAFDNETLAQAAAEFSRYSAIPIVLDPTIQNETVTGLFVSNDPVGFARAAALSLDLHAEVGDSQVRLTR